MTLTVLQTLPALEVGGVERGTLQVAKALVERGHRSIVISAGGRLQQALCAQGSEHYNWPIGKKNPVTFALALKLARFIKNNHVDVLHTRSRLPAWVSYLALKKLGEQSQCRLVTTVHGPYRVNRYSKIMTSGERVIAISDYIRNYIYDNYPTVDRDKISVVHRGVDSKEYPFNYTPDAEWLLKWRTLQPQLLGKTVLTLPGRVTRWKGQEDFIEIIAQLSKQDNGIHGVIAGAAHPKKHAFMQHLQQLVRAKRLQQHITFLGHRDDMREVMAASNLILSLAKEPEAFGRTGLEALALGRPVVAYGHGGGAEVLNELQPQGLVRPHDIPAAVAAITTQLKLAPDIKQDNPFTLDNMLNKTLAIYEELHQSRRAEKSSL